jgi:hypothetical protein
VTTSARLGGVNGSGIRFFVGCALIIQTILLDPSRAVWTDRASNVSSLDPSGADQADAENPSRNRKVEVRIPPRAPDADGLRASWPGEMFGSTVNQG